MPKLKGIRHGTKRKFGGKIYEAWDFALLKSSAERKANEARKYHKVKARVSSSMPPVSQHGWVVWVRPYPK